MQKGGLVVVLEEVKNPARLQRYRGTLESGPGWEDTAVVVKSGEAVTQSLSNVAAKAAEEGAGSLTFLVLEPAFAADGSSVLREKSGESDFFDAPAPAVLDLSHANGGVVPYEPTTRNVRMAFREMKVAPEDGYQPRIELEPGRQDLYFYCRIDGKFGKGRITAPRRNPPFP